MPSDPGTLIEQAQRHCSANAASISTRCSGLGAGLHRGAMKLTRGNVSQAAKNARHQTARRCTPAWNRRKSSNRPRFAPAGDSMYLDHFG